jgi:hypothetical protein
MPSIEDQSQPLDEPAYTPVYTEQQSEISTESLNGNQSPEPDIASSGAPDEADVDGQAEINEAETQKEQERVEEQITNS